MAIISDYQEEPETNPNPKSKPKQGPSSSSATARPSFSASLDPSNPLGFVESAFQFLAEESDFFLGDSAERDVVRVVRAVREKAMKKKKKKQKVEEVTERKIGKDEEKAKKVEEAEMKEAEAEAEAGKEKEEDKKDDEKSGLFGGRLPVKRSELTTAAIHTPKLAGTDDLSTFLRLPSVFLF